MPGRPPVAPTGADIAPDGARGAGLARADEPWQAGRVRLCVFIEPQLGASYEDQLAVARRAEECGFDGFLGKPLDPDRFPDQIRRVLKGEPVWEIH